MQASTSVQAVARRHMMSSISSFVRLSRLQWYRKPYGTDRRTLSGNSAISRRKTQIEMNMDWKANINNSSDSVLVAIFLKLVLHIQPQRSRLSTLMFECWFWTQMVFAYMNRSTVDWLNILCIILKKIERECYVGAIHSSGFSICCVR